MIENDNQCNRLFAKCTALLRSASAAPINTTQLYSQPAFEHSGDIC